MRKLTTAEVVAFTHHVMAQKGWDKGQTKDSDLIMRLAASQGFESIDIRPNWKKYLQTTNAKESDFLKDGVHLNSAGEALWLKISLPHFKYHDDAKPYWEDWIKVYTPDGKPFTADAKQEYPAESILLAQPLKFSFEGNRIDILADATVGQKLGTAKILIDGKVPSSFPELYYVTRGSRPPNFFQPMLRRAQIGKDPVVEKWTLTFNGISNTGEDFSYEAHGSVTGPDGKGNAKEKFVSNSGRLVIDPQWFIMQVLVGKISQGKPYPNGTTCTFEVRPNYMDVWKPEAPVASNNASALSSAWNGFGTVLASPIGSGSEQRYTLASGLSNGPHTLEIIPNGDGELPVRAIVTHKPPVK